MPEKGRPRERYCKRGHDTYESGRVPNNGWCRTCARLAESNGGRIPDPGPQSHPKNAHSPEWERARVDRWTEIVKADPLEIGLKSTQLRRRAFDRRYERLEAEVPTP